MKITETILTAPALPLGRLSLPVPPARANTARAEADSSQREKLLSALLGEVEAVAVLVMASASLANALSAPIGQRIPRSAFVTYLPTELVLYTTAAGDLIRAGISPDVLATQQMLNARLTLAKRLSTAFAGEVEGQPAVVQPEALADAWQRACGAAFAAVQALRQALIETTGGRIQPRIGRTAENLKAAQRGEFPCVLGDGSIVVPGWAERPRPRVRRQPLDIACVIQAESRTVMGQIYDLSTGGLGFTGAGELKRGSPITVELPNGRWLTGKVSWCSGDRAGMKFDSPLAYDDPLLPPLM